MPYRDTFIGRVLDGRLREEQINDSVEAWHKSRDKSWTPIHHWLGFSKAEYARWAESPSALKDIVAARRADNDWRSRTEMGSPINPAMGEGRYQDALRRFRQRIANGLPLDLDDSNDTGNKYTSASWGLCECIDKAAYPDFNDHLFPDRIAEDAKNGYDHLLSPRDPPEGATCPLDRGLQKPDKLNPGQSGCFARCRLFRPVKGTLPPGERVPRAPTREETLKLYDVLIAQRERQFGKKVTEDDGEALWKPGGSLV